MPAAIHAACSGYKSPISDISGYLSIICLASFLDTSRFPVRICDTSCLEQLSNCLEADNTPPDKAINLSNSLFMLISIRIVALQVNQFIILCLHRVDLANSPLLYNSYLITGLI